jgi:hypothetical protein
MRPQTRGIPRTSVTFIARQHAPPHTPSLCRTRLPHSKSVGVQSVLQVASKNCLVRRRSQTRSPRHVRCPAHSLVLRETRCNSTRAAQAKSSNPTDTSFRGLRFGPQQIESAHSDCQHDQHTYQFDADNPVPAFRGGRVLEAKSTSPCSVFIHHTRQTKSRRADRR